jgi:hypothetical protein
MKSSKKLSKSLKLTSMIFSNICKIEDIPPELRDHFNKTFKYDDMRKIFESMNIKVKSGNKNLIMLQFCQLYCALIKLLMKSSTGKKGKKSKGKKSKGKGKKTQKGGLDLKDEYGQTLSLEDEGMGLSSKIIRFIKNNTFAILKFLFNLYIIYIVILNVKNLLELEITIDGPRPELSNGLVAYQKGDKLLSLINPEEINIQKFSILDILRRSEEILPQIQQAFQDDMGDRIDEYIGELRKDFQKRVSEGRHKATEKLQKNVGVTETGVDQIRVLNMILNPTGTTTRLIQDGIKMGRREARDTMKEVNRGLEDMTTLMGDELEDMVDDFTRNFTDSVTLLMYSGYYFLSLLIYLLYTQVLRRRNEQNQEGQPELGNNPGNKPESCNKKKKSKKRSKRLRR